MTPKTEYCEFGDPHINLPPPPPGIIDEPALRTHGSWICTLMDALEVCFHTILYERGVYPKEIFIAGRMYDTLAMQCRVRDVAEYVRHVVEAVGEQVVRGTISSISLTILHAPTRHALERFLFTFTSFPTASEHPNPFSLLLHATAENDTSSNSNAITPGAESTTTTSRTTSTIPPIPRGQKGEGKSNPNDENPMEQDHAALFTAPLPGTTLSSLHHQFRALLHHLTTLSTLLSPLPPACDLTWVVMAESCADSPQLQGGPGERGKWVVGERKEREGGRRGEGGVKGVAVRGVRSGGMGVEVWVEESKVKGKVAGKGKGAEG
ncbi:DNA-binding protein [Ascodesmis nigricans]|uniref:DNA-binding protein n=1 Tax=Ascodesmis nigricans TaxID=341454 RepID=A0A4S2MQ49_9PEZI|nr:DNA-binding protein [Ascodesmis nigricans]